MQGSKNFFKLLVSRGEFGASFVIAHTFEAVILGWFLALEWDLHVSREHRRLFPRKLLFFCRVSFKGLLSVLQPGVQRHGRLRLLPLDGHWLADWRLDKNGLFPLDWRQLHRHVHGLHVNDNLGRLFLNYDIAPHLFSESHVLAGHLKSVEVVTNEHGRIKLNLNFKAASDSCIHLQGTRNEFVPIAIYQFKLRAPGDSLHARIL